MRCGDFERVIDLRREGRLDAGTATAWSRHVERCHRCTEAEIAQARLEESIEALHRSEDAPAGQWASIRSRIDAETSAAGPGPATVDRAPGVGHRSAWAALAAACLALVFASVAAVVRTDGEPVDPEPAPVAGSTTGSAAWLQDRAEFADGFREMRTSLLEQVANGSGERSDVVAAVVENLGVIDRAEAQILEALERDPDDPALNRLLHTIYRRQVDTLEAALATTVPANRAIEEAT